MTTPLGHRFQELPHLFRPSWDHNPHEDRQKQRNTPSPEGRLRQDEM